MKAQALDRPHYLRYVRGSGLRSTQQGANTMVERFIEFIQRSRKRLIAAAVVAALYAVSGFFLAPWLLKEQAAEVFQERFGAELQFARVAVNPFALSVTLDGLHLSDPNTRQVVGVDQIYVNFQLSSLFRWALTFAELRITQPTIALSRDASGKLNTDFLFAGDQAEADESPDSADGAIPRLLIQDFRIEALAVDWRDELPAEVVSTRFGPASIDIEALSTLPYKAGQQRVVIEAEQFGSLSWTGSLELNPLMSSGSAALEGARFPLVSAYLRHDLGFDIADGRARVALQYDIQTQPDGTVSLRLSDAALGVSDLQVAVFRPDTADHGSRVLVLPSLSVSVDELLWPEQRVRVALVNLVGGDLNLSRDDSGALNIDPAASSSNDPGATPVQSATSAGAAGTPDIPWNVVVDLLSVEDFALNWQDRGISPAATAGIDNIKLRVSDITNEPNQRMPMTLSLEARQGGSAAVDGTVQVLPALAYDLAVEFDKLALGNAQPYITPFADLVIDSGHLSIDAQLSGSSAQPLYLDGSVTVAELDVIQASAGSTLGSWEAMRADQLVLDSAANSLSVSELVFERPYADILISEAGVLNLGQVEKTATPENAASAMSGAQDGAPASTEARVNDTSTHQAEQAQAAELAVTVGRVVVDEGAADFADLSLPLPFAAHITDFNGEMTTLSSASTQPSSLAFEGAVDEYGLVRVTGDISALDPTQFTDVDVRFQNIQIPKFTAYSIPLAGHEISQGALDLDLGYSLDDGQLVGRNNIVLRNFELGDKVPHPDAADLPLGLAVALLKDVDGKIDIDLPVKGDVNDPEFGYGGVVGKALANLIVKIVASPFMLLGNLVGADAGDLDSLVFYPGRSDVTPPELEKLAKLTEALALRPELALQIPGTYARTLDTIALQRTQLDARVAELMSQVESADEMYALRKRRALESLIIESTADPTVLQEMQAGFTSQPEDDADPQLDELAYVSHLEAVLLDAQQVTDASLSALGTARATAIQTALLAIDPTLAPRLILTELAEAPADEGKQVVMRVSLLVNGRD